MLPHGLKGAAGSAMTTIDDTTERVLFAVSVRAAVEGVPVSAISRITGKSFAEVHADLTTAYNKGAISDLPASDWPPGQKRSERVPTMSRDATPEAIEFACGKRFKLSKLQSGFVMALLRCDSVDKGRLHAVVEAQRASRATRPDNAEETDPKIVDVIICNLRKRLVAVNPEFKIETLWGRGYSISPPIKKLIFAAIEEELG